MNIQPATASETFVDNRLEKYSDSEKEEAVRQLDELIDVITLIITEELKPTQSF